MRTLGAMSVLVLSACGPDPKQAWRGTENGQNIYEYTVQHWPTALWSEAKLENWVKRDGRKLCPQGYREISRTLGSSHVYYGSPISMPYNDVIVKITCPAGAKPATAAKTK